MSFSLRVALLSSNKRTPDHPNPPHTPNFGSVLSDRFLYYYFQDLTFFLIRRSTATFHKQIFFFFEFNCSLRDVKLFMYSLSLSSENSLYITLGSYNVGLSDSKCKLSLSLYYYLYFPEVYKNGCKKKTFFFFSKKIFELFHKVD